MLCEGATRHDCGRELGGVSGEGCGLGVKDEIEEWKIEWGRRGSRRVTGRRRKGIGKSIEIERRNI